MNGGQRIWRFVVLACLLLVLNLADRPNQSAVARPAAELEITVDTTMDTNAPARQVCSAAANDCSLRGAISKANADAANRYTIRLPAGLYTLTLAGTQEDQNATGDLDILTGLTLVGAGADATFIQAGPNPEAGIDRVFHVIQVSGHPVTLKDLTLRYGRDGVMGGGGIFQQNGALVLDGVTVAQNTALSGSSGGGLLSTQTVQISNSTFIGNLADKGEGGALYTVSTPPIMIDSSAFLDNQANYGGAIQVNGPMTITNSTFAGNLAQTAGGALAQWNIGNLRLYNVTIAGNSVVNSSAGWAIQNVRTVYAYNTIFAADEGKQPCTSFLTDNRNSLSTAGCFNQTIAEPRLGPLKQHGGRVNAFSLLPGSPAIDAGDPDSCAALDVRGVSRPFDGDYDGEAACDIGAYEYDQPPTLYLPLVRR